MRGDLAKAGLSLPPEDLLPLLDGPGLHDPIPHEGIAGDEGLGPLPRAEQAHGPILRSGLWRLLDPDNDSVTLQSLKRAAAVLGKKLKIELV